MHFIYFTRPVVRFGSLAHYQLFFAKRSNIKKIEHFEFSFSNTHFKTRVQGDHTLMVDF
mgnify:CR=1 FL=1